LASFLNLLRTKKRLVNIGRNSFRNDNISIAAWEIFVAAIEEPRV
jgi:hypothetical protein